MLSIKTISKVTRRYRHLVRYQQIIGIIFKHGFENVIYAMNIDHYIDTGLKFIPFAKPLEKDEKYTKYQRIRMALEELGPTFVKMGQVLSSRPDLIPVGLTKELSKLQDHIPPFEFEQVRSIISSEFGKPLNQVFYSFEEQPFASASIGQVHRAKLSEDQPIAVKVQRPGIRKTIEVDLEIMSYLASVMENNIQEVAVFRPVKIVEEFARTLEKELDYTVEAANMEQMAEQFKKEDTIHIPKLYRDQSSERVLSMEYIQGFKSDDIDAIELAGLDRKAITRAGADFIMKQVFEYGFFHADPHPGNIFILRDQRICVVDFGMTGFVDQTTREIFVDLVHTLASKNTKLTARLLCELADFDRVPNMTRLEKDIAVFSSVYLSKALKDIKPSRMVHRLLELCAEHGMRIPPDLFLMIKAFISVEGLARVMDPEFDMVEHARPYVRAATMQKYSPQRMSRNLLGIAREFYGLLQTLPIDAGQLIDQAKQGKLTGILKIDGLDKLRTTLDQTSNRLSFAIIITGLILGSAIVLNSKVPPVIFGVSLIGIAGFMAAAVMGLWLLIAIIRRGRL
ncbi:MAG TPA: ABC transporter [Desulfobacteraceae bacterium]|nr:ABC transporter [Desulfobacteraceae bacterium]